MNTPILDNNFSRTHWWWPLLGFCLAALGFALSSLDLVLADQVYQWSGGYWQYEDAWFTTTLVHDGGRTVVAVMALVLIVTAVIFQCLSGRKRWRKGLWYLLISTLVSGILINLLKSVTHVDCPWDLLRYGGDRIYVPLFSLLTYNQKFGACFPAGHASAAYAWLGLYYFCFQYLPHWRFKALAGVLAAGILFGVCQQVRGAHFMSHDLWSLGISWAVASALYWVFFQENFGLRTEKRKKRGSSACPAVLPLES